MLGFLVDKYTNTMGLVSDDELLAGSAVSAYAAPPC